MKNIKLQASTHLGPGQVAYVQCKVKLGCFGETWLMDEVDLAVCEKKEITAHEEWFQEVNS